ncbi:immune-associated nucleotide-binding protein 12-like [Colossoma macropomum]|uniref:immune-associated nucleotide-binding protein 12-like n=1 Tax=Colossoma macropomum TaxID=42526 RepID=UPI001864D7BF|nr:immune-associated nucleotide-binding protein 12-like [Colossoma macropomum]
MERRESAGALHLSELRMVLVGGQRVGKSSSGNTILGMTAFDAERGFERCVRKQAEVAGRSVVVTDTPGWDKLRAEDTPTRIRTEILNSISVCAPGPHAFLLVIPVGDFSEQQRQGAENMLTTIGAAVWRHTIVLLTWGAELGSRAVEEFLEIQPHLKALVEKCGGHVYVLDNKSWTDKPQTDELFRRVEELVEENCGVHFSTDTNYMYSKLEASKKELEELREQHERDVMKMKTDLIFEVKEKEKVLENLKHDHEVQLMEKDRDAEELRTLLEEKIMAKEGKIQELKSLYEGQLKEKDHLLEDLRLQNKEKMMEKASEVEGLKAQIRASMMEMQAEVEELEQQCRKMTEEQAVKDSQIEQLEKNLKEHAKMLEDREKDLAEMKLQNNEQAKAKMQELAELEKDVEKMKAQFVEMKNEIQEVKVQREEKERDLHQAKASCEELRDEVEQLEQLCRERQDKINSLKLTQRQKDEEISGLKVAGSSLLDKNKQAEERLKETQQLLRESENKLDELKQNYSRSLRRFRLNLEDMTRGLKETELEMETDESKLSLGKRRSSKEFLHPIMGSGAAGSSRGSSRVTQSGSAVGSSRHRSDHITHIKP